MARLTKYHNKKVPDLWKAPNTDDHSVYLATVKAESWSYLAKGNLQTVKQFLRDLKACGGPEKIRQGDKILQDRNAQNSPGEYPQGRETGAH